MNRQHYNHFPLPSLKPPPLRFAQPAGVSARLAHAKRVLHAKDEAFEESKRKDLYGEFTGAGHALKGSR